MKLTKAQRSEFSKSAISADYATLNFISINKKQATTLLGARTKKFPAGANGWADYAQSFLKPVSPRSISGKTVKYESLVSPRLIKINHPTGTATVPGTAFVEGFKKAVAFAEHSKIENVYHFPGLGGGINLASSMLAIAATALLVIDNDISVAAQRNAALLLAKLPTYKVASFTGFKGIDDLIHGGGEYIWLSSTDWQQSYAGYIGSTQVINNQFLPPDLNYTASTKVISLISPKGSGKTTLMRNLAAKKSAVGLPVLYVAHRIALGRDAAKRIGIPYINKEADVTGSMALCIDSILSIKIGAELDGAVIFLDEFTQAFAHMLTSSTLNRRRGEIITHFIKVLRYISENGGLIVLADADLNEQFIKFVTTIIDDDKNCLTVLNEYVASNGPCYFYSGAPGVTSTLRGYPVIEKLLANIAKGEKCYVSLGSVQAESLLGTKNVVELLSTLTDSILEINAQTVANPNHAAYRATDHINELVGKYQVIVASPTLGTGVDIQAKVDGIYCIQSGVQSVNEVCQALARIRDFSTPRYIHVPETHSMNHEYYKKFTNAGSIRVYIENAVQASINCLLVDDTMKMAYELSEAFLAASNGKQMSEGQHFCHLLKRKLAFEGHQIIEVEAPSKKFNEIEVDLEIIRKANVEIEDNLLISAQLVDDETYQQLLLNASQTDEDAAKIEKFQFHRRNGLELNAELLAKKKEGYFDSAFKHYQLENYKQTEVLYNRSLSFATKSTFVASEIIKIKSRFEAIRAVKLTNLLDVSTIKPSEIEGYRKQLVTETEVFGKDESEISLPAVLKTFGFSVESRRQLEGGKRRVGYDITRNTDALYQQLCEFWGQRDSTNVQSFQEYLATEEARKVAATQNKTVKFKDEVCLKYTDFSTRSKAVIDLPSRVAYTVVSELSKSYFKQWLTRLAQVSIDIETYCPEGSKMGGLDYLNGTIALIQFSDGVKTFLVPESEIQEYFAEIQGLLANPAIHKFGHNFQFDLRFLREKFSVTPTNLGCSLIAVKCLTGDYGAAQVIGKSLKASCHNFLGIELNKTEQKSAWNGELTPEQLQYAANDSYYTFHLYTRLMGLLASPQLIGLNIPDKITATMYRLESEFLDVVQAIETTGYTLDTTVLQQCTTERQTKFDELTAAWEALMPNLKPTQSLAIARELTRRYGIEITSVGKKAVFDIDIPELTLRKQLDAVSRDLKLFGILHGQTTVKPVITSLSGTGRCAVGNSKVNKKFIPLHGISARNNVSIPPEWNFTPVRACFLIGQVVDLCASHGHISANLSGDKNAIAAYLDESVDNHCVVAASVAVAAGFDAAEYTPDFIKKNKKSGICKGLRDTAKNTYYGWLNGAGTSTIKLQIQANLGILVSSEKAAIALDGLKQLFVETTEYVKVKLNELGATTSEINGKLVGHMIVEGQLISWVVGEAGGSVNVPATKATGAIWSRVEATLMKQAGLEILKLIQDGADGQILGFNHDDYNLQGSLEFKQSAHAIIKRKFCEVAKLTGAGAFSKFEETAYLKDGVTPVTNWSQK